MGKRGGRKNYRTGRRYEYKERDYWQDCGYYSERAYASKGVWDVLATNGEVTVFVQVKTFKSREPEYRDDIDRLRTIPKGSGVRRLLVVYGPRKSGVKTPRKVIEV